MAAPQIFRCDADTGLVFLTITGVWFGGLNQYAGADPVPARITSNFSNLGWLSSHWSF